MFSQTCFTCFIFFLHALRVIFKKQIVFLWVRPHFLMEQLTPQVASHQQSIAFSPSVAHCNRESKEYRAAIYPPPLLQSLLNTFLVGLFSCPFLAVLKLRTQTWLQLYGSPALPMFFTKVVLRPKCPWSPGDWIDPGMAKT